MLRAIATLCRKLRINAKNESGQTVLIIAAVLTGVALTGAALFLNLDVGKRIIDRMKGANASQGNALQAVLAYYLTDADGAGAGTAPLRVPCPSAYSSGAPTGDAASVCDGSTGPNAGVLPWKTLGLSRDQALDSNGNYFTYVVSTDAPDICDTVSTNFGGASEVTGTLKQSSLQVTDALGNVNRLPFAIIGHGANGLGARSSNNTATGVPQSANETTNCDPLVCSGHTPSMLSVVSGPFTGSQGSSAFDDQVFVPSRSSLQNLCESLTPGGALNATLSDNFDQVTSQIGATGLDSTKYSADSNNVTVGAETNNRGNRVAQFAGAGSLLVTNATNGTYDFDPRARPLYVSATWVPDAGGAGTGSGMSIATRVTARDQTSSSNDFNSNGRHGITFQFFSGSGTAGLNTISIKENAAALGSVSPSYTLTAGKRYYIEAYDNGSQVWARITQADNFSNSTTVGPFSTSADLDGANQVAFVGGSNTNYVDNVSVGLAMLAARFDGSDDYITAANLGDAVNLTVEAWIRPRAAVASGATAAIAASWDPTPASLASNAFRLAITSNQLQLDLSGRNAGDTADINDTYTVGYTPQVDTWSHVAATYAASSGTVSFYVNGSLIGTAHSDHSATPGVAAGTLPFTVGADDGGASDFFNGEISDVRVWSAARTAMEILSNYNQRLSYSTTTGVSNLTLNWKLDSDGVNGPTTIASSSAFSTGTTTAHTGTLSSGATYVGALANYFRPFAGTVDGVIGVCPGFVAHAYQCDYRAAGTQTISFPANLSGANVKVWGGGGGGFSDGSSRWSGGGGGGFSGGWLYSIGATGISGQTLAVVVGGGGTSTAGTGANTVGGGGGGASAVRLNGGNVGLAAGGGGGGSYNVSNAGGVNCNATNALNSLLQCGLGGGGGGPGNLLASTQTTQAPDRATGLCGGRGGDNTPGSGSSPPTATACPSTVGLPSSTTGGAGNGTGGGGAGGASSVGAGGAGGSVSGTNRFGPGGGGGGVSAAGLTAGGAQAGGHNSGAQRRAFGGGGGSGFGDANLGNALGQTGSSTFYTESSTSYSRGLGGGAAASVNVTITLSHTADTSSLRFTNSGISTFPYTITASGNNTEDTAADNLVAAINGNATLQAANITAAKTDQTNATLTIYQKSVAGNSTTVDTTGTSAASTITLSPSTGQMNATRNFDYKPSYASSYPDPGAGGTAGTDGLTGKDGAAVIKW